MNEFQLFEQLSKNIYDIPKQEKLVVANLEGLVSLFLDDRFIQSCNTTKTGPATVLMIMCISLERFDFKVQQIANATMKISYSYYTSEVVANYSDIAETFLNMLFHNFLIKNARYGKEAINLLLLSNSFYFENKFNVAKAYLCYYAYNLREYNLSKSITDVLVIQLASNKYIDHFDYCLMNYYKGLIYIANEKINEAAISFILALSIYPSGMTQTTYNIIQIECSKRLVIIYPVISSDLQKQVISCLDNNEVLFALKNMESYSNIKTVTFNSKSSYEDYMKCLNQFKTVLSADKVLVSTLFKQYLINLGYIQTCYF